jgi:ABC-type amino acid transport substrate-binding protein
MQTNFNPPPILSSIPASLKSACAAAKSPKIAEIQKRGVLNWAIGVSPPFGFQLPNGQWAGVEAQDAQELAKILGVKPSITAYSYDVLPTTLPADKSDIIGAQLFVTAARQKVINFSKVYYLSGQLFYVLKNSPYQTIADLNKPNINFIAGTGSGQLTLAPTYIPKAHINNAPLQGQLLLYNFLVSGQDQVTMGESAPMRVEIQKYGNLAAIGLHGRITSQNPSSKDILSPFKVAFGLPKGDPGWQNCVNAWVTNMLTTGRMQTRLNYWLQQKVS